MRTDWHRYNLKRRVASLPPISAEIFAEKVLTAQASSTAVAAKASFEKLCAACQKTYYSENAYENHIKSQKHRLRGASLAKDGAPTEDEETASVMSSTISLGEPINGAMPTGVSIAPSENAIDPEAEAEFSKVVNSIKETKITEEPVGRRPTRPRHPAGEQRVEHPLSPEFSRDGPTATAEASTTKSDTPTIQCLFCNHSSATLSLNVSHMTTFHGLFIPEQRYLIDLEGLIRWLWNRINEEPHECLYCHKAKSTAEAVQDHMKDVGHCKIAFENESDMIEVGQFYDFRSTYSDQEDSDENVNADGDQDMEDGWESDSDVASEDLDDEIEIDGTSNSKQRPSKPRASDKQQALISDNELYLPSGKIAGHRSLNKYYRQNLHFHPSPAELIERHLLLEAAVERGEENTAMTNGGQEGGDTGRGRQLITRANGGQGMLGVTDAKKREVQAVEKRDRKRAQMAEKRYQWGVDKRGNMQKHFRDPLLQ
ncbi:MAG: hypothetical protein Q9217_000476 [Psora testacea]